MCAGAVMIGLGLKLLGIGRWIGGAVSGVMRWLFASTPRWMAAGWALTILGAWLVIARAHDATRAAQADAVACNVARSIERASIVRLRAAVTADNFEDAARADAYQSALAEGARERARLADAYRPTRTRVDALRAAVGQNEAGTCLTPDDVREALRHAG